MTPTSSITSQPTLICYDGSPSSRRAIEVAGQTLSRGRTVVLNVWSAPAAVLADSFSTTGLGPPQAELETEAARHASETAREAERAAAEAGLEVDALEARNGSSVWQTILDVAERMDAGLIVAGTRGATAVQERPLGSVSDGLVRHSTRPVLIVPTSTPS